MEEKGKFSAKSKSRPGCNKWFFIPTVFSTALSYARAARQAKTTFAAYANGFEQSCQFQPMPSHVGQVEVLLQPPEAEATRNANAGRLRYARIASVERPADCGSGRRR
jgi:hypothetical protein